MQFDFPSLIARLRDAPVTAALVAANLAVFAALALDSGALWSPPSAALVAWGSNYGALALNGQPWRLLSTLFVHGGLLHLGLNMLALWQLGAVVESLFGRWRFVALYLGAGLVASVASLWWRPEVNSVGASGAIFGVFGALLVDLRLRRDLLPRVVFRRMRSGLLSLLGFSLFAGLAVPGIDNAAHVGGLAGGVLLGYALAPRPALARWPDLPTRLATTFVMVAVALIGWLDIAPPAPPAAPQVAAAPGDADWAIRAFVAEEHDLVRGHELLLDGFLRRRLSAGELARVVEDDLLPRWERQIEQLAVAQGATEQGQGHGDARLAALIEYARLRHDALQALLLGVRTRNPGWMATSAQLQRQAEAVLVALRAGLEHEPPDEAAP